MQDKGFNLFSAKIKILVSHSSGCVRLNSYRFPLHTHELLLTDFSPNQTTMTIGFKAQSRLFATVVSYGKFLNENLEKGICRGFADRFVEPAWMFVFSSCMWTVSLGRGILLKKRGWSLWGESIWRLVISNVQSLIKQLRANCSS